MSDDMREELTKEMSNVYDLVDERLQRFAETEHNRRVVAADSVAASEKIVELEAAKRRLRGSTI